MEENVTLAELGLFRYVPDIVTVRQYARLLHECHTLKQVLQNVIYYMLVKEESITFTTVIKKDFYSTIEPFIKHICSHIPTTTWREGIYRLREHMKGDVRCWARMTEKESRHAGRHTVITANRKMAVGIAVGLSRLAFGRPRPEKPRRKPVAVLVPSEPKRRIRVGDTIKVELPMTAPVVSGLADGTFPRHRITAALRAANVLLRTNKPAMERHRSPIVLAKGTVRKRICPNLSSEVNVKRSVLKCQNRLAIDA